MYLSVLCTCILGHFALSFDRQPPGRQLRPFSTHRIGQPGSWLVRIPASTRPQPDGTPRRPSTHLAQDSCPSFPAPRGSPSFSTALLLLLPPPTANLIRKSGLHFHTCSRFPDGPRPPLPSAQILHPCAGCDRRTVCQSYQAPSQSRRPGNSLAICQQASAS